MGLHTGQPQVAGDRYLGLDVSRAARICAAAHGGQALLSQATRDLVEHELPDGVSLRDLGEHRLKDLTSAQRLSQIIVDGLADEFPPLLTLENRPTNLPGTADAADRPRGRARCGGASCCRERTSGW